MIELYQFDSSPFTEKVRRALGYKGVAYKAIDVDRAQVPQGAYEFVSPTGKFPAIMDGDKPVWDSTDILLHVEANYDGPALIPANKRDAAIAHAIEEWADESLYFYEVQMRLGWKHNRGPIIERFSKQTGIAPEVVDAMIEESVPNTLNAQGIGRKPVEQIISEINRQFAALDALLDGHDWFVGDAPSIADFAVFGQLTAILDAREAQEALARTANVKSWQARLEDIAPLEPPV